MRRIRQIGGGKLIDAAHHYTVRICNCALNDLRHPLEQKLPG
jgi:hypothetical protein